jgi:hypothetical protein
MRDRPGVVIRSLPDTSAMYPSMMSQTLCSKGIFAGGSFTADVLPTLSREANSSRVSVFDSASMIRVWPFFRNRSVVNFDQVGEGRLSWGLFSKVNLLVAIFSAFSAPHGKSRSPKTDLPTLLKMRRTARVYQERAGPADRADISHVRIHVRQQNLDFRENVTAIQALAGARGWLCWPAITTPTIATATAVSTVANGSHKGRRTLRDTHRRGILARAPGGSKQPVSQPPGHRRRCHIEQVRYPIWMVRHRVVSSTSQVRTEKRVNTCSTTAANRIKIP